MQFQRVCHNTLPWLISFSLDVIPMSRTVLYVALAVSAFGFAVYAAIQCFGYGLAVGGSRGVVGGEAALHHYGTLSEIWFFALVFSLIGCGLFIRAAAIASRSSTQVHRD